MNKKYASSNVSFAYLASSAGFLNQLLDDISSCILLMDKNMELQSYNEPLKNIFSNKKDEHLLYQRCGEALGCAHSVEEAKRCGETSKCKFCELRIDSLWAYSTNQPVFKKNLEREFYKLDNTKRKKYLQYSIRPFHFESDLYLAVIVDDITPLVEKTRLIVEQQSLIEELKVGQSAN